MILLLTTELTRITSVLVSTGSLEVTAISVVDVEVNELVATGGSVTRTVVVIWVVVELLMLVVVVMMDLVEVEDVLGAL